MCLQIYTYYYLNRPAYKDAYQSLKGSDFLKLFMIKTGPYFIEAAMFMQIVTDSFQTCTLVLIIASEMKRPVYLLWLLVCLVLVQSCANMMMPTGGPKDVKAPVLRKRNLMDSAINFKGGTITFEFDEAVQVKDVQNQLIITPLLKKNPPLTAHRKKVMIKIDDTLLEKNTTYFISMGSAIQDVREGNILKNMSFTFSTGPYFDSMSLSGHVMEAATGRPDTMAYVLLYPETAPDSAFLHDSKSRRWFFLF